MSLYTRMHKILEDEFGSLPTEGVLAGQAVAEAYFQAESINIRSRMKDLDWFVNSDDRVEDARGVFASSITPQVQIHIPSYDADLSVGGMLKHGLYTVVTSDVINDGRINRVLIRNPQSSSPVSAIQILNGFDINCTACALDLESEEIVKHPEFDAFCQSLEINFISLHTPLSSLVRVFEKKDYIAGTTIDMASLMDVVSCAVWSRYCEDYTSFDESAFKAPLVYKKGTGMTVARFDSLCEPAKDMLNTHFNRHVVELLDDSELYTFIPKEEPKKISALISVLGSEVSIASYSLQLMQKIAHMPILELYESVIWPLKSFETTRYCNSRTRMIRGFVQGALLKGFFESHGALSFKEIANALNAALIYDTTNAEWMGEDKTILFSDLICDVLELYINSTNSIDKTSNAIEAICHSFRAWVQKVPDVSIFLRLSWMDRRAVSKTLIERAYAGDSISLVLKEMLDKPIEPVVDIDSMTFGLSADEEQSMGLKYSVKLARCLNDIAGRGDFFVSRLDATILRIECIHGGVITPFIAEVVWNERNAKYDVYSRHLINNNFSSDEPVVDAVSLHIENVIQKHTRYSFKRLRALVPEVKSKISSFARDIKELVVQRKEQNEVQRKIRRYLQKANAESPDELFEDEFPF